jgi:hypothetical protein
MPERITLSCPACSHSWPAAATAVGEPAPCPACGEVVRPRRAPAPPAARPAGRRHTLPLWAALGLAAAALVVGLSLPGGSAPAEADAATLRTRLQERHDWAAHPRLRQWYILAEDINVMIVHRDDFHAIELVPLPSGTVLRGADAQAWLLAQRATLPAGTPVAALAIHTAADGGIWYLVTASAEADLPLTAEDGSCTFGWVVAVVPWGDHAPPPTLAQDRPAVPTATAADIRALYRQITLPLLGSE